MSARSVKMLVRADSLSRSMSHYLVERIKTIPNITVEPITEVIEVHGDDRLTGLTIRHHDTETNEERPAGAVFIFIGAEPQTEWLEGTVCRDAEGIPGYRTQSAERREASCRLDARSGSVLCWKRMCPGSLP